MKPARLFGLGSAVAILASAPGLSQPVANRTTAGGQGQAVESTDWTTALAALPTEGFERPEGAWTLALPEDHGLHPAARSEVWQIVAHLADADGVPVGVQFLLLRIGLLPPDAPTPPSPWVPRALYRGHVVVTDGARGIAHAEERFGRVMDGLVGHDPEEGMLRLDHWTLRHPGSASAGAWQLQADADGARVDLTLMAATAPISPGVGNAPFRGYAVTHLAVAGTVATQAGQRAVSGAAWLEHLWGDLPLPGGTPVVSDRLLLHLDDGAAVSVIRSRRRDGGGTPTVEAAVIGADGTATAVTEGTASVDVTRRWQGEGGPWPVGWRLRTEALDLAVTPVIDDQDHGFMAPLWSGLVRAEGTRDGRPVRGRGTLQLTGHEGP